jgi:hypothetical protein
MRLIGVTSACACEVVKSARLRSSEKRQQATSQVHCGMQELANRGGLAMRADKSVMNLARYLAKNAPPEKRIVLRATAAVMIAYTPGVFAIFLLF